MQRKAKNIDQKNGGSSEEMGSECPGSMQDELKDGKRGGGEREKQSPRYRNNKKRNVKRTKRNRQESLHVIDPLHHTMIPNTKRVYKAKPTHVATQRTDRVKGEREATDHLTTLWTNHQRAWARARRKLVGYHHTVQSPVQDLADIHHHPESC
jgi:hypothetical protein